MIRPPKNKQIKIRVTKNTNYYFEKQLIRLGKTKSEAIREYIYNTIHNFKNYNQNKVSCNYEEVYSNHEKHYSKFLTKMITVKVEESVLEDLRETLGRMNISMSRHIRDFIVGVARLSVPECESENRALVEYKNSEPMWSKDAVLSGYMIIEPLGRALDETKQGAGVTSKDFLTQEEKKYWIDKMHLDDRIKYSRSKI